MHHIVVMWTKIVVAVAVLCVAEIHVAESTIKKRDNTEQPPCNCADLAAQVANLMENQQSAGADLEARVATMVEASLSTFMEKTGEEYMKKSEFLKFKLEERIALNYMLQNYETVTEMNQEMRYDLNWLQTQMCNVTEDITNNKKLAASETTKLLTRLTNVDTKLTTRLEQVESTGVSERRTLQQGITLAVNSATSERTKMARRISNVEGKINYLNVNVGFHVTSKKSTVPVSSGTVKFDWVMYSWSSLGGSLYNTNRGAFTAPIRGLYCFSIVIMKLSNKDIGAYIMAQGGSKIASAAAARDWQSASATTVTWLEKGDRVWVYSEYDYGLVGLGSSAFTGFLIAP